MIKNHQGGVNLHLLLTIFLGLGMVLFGVLAVLAYQQRTTALNTVNAQVDNATGKAKSDQKASDDTANAKANELPYKTYTALPADGGFQLQFPKDWSVYAEHSTKNGSDQLMLLADLATVNFNSDTYDSQPFKLEIVNTPAVAYVKTFDSGIRKKSISTGSMQVSGIASTVLKGVFQNQHSVGVKVIVPVRDNAFVFTAENQSRIDNFNQILATAKIFP
jgi:hypothetical protein